MKKALERHDNGEAIVVPIILRPCDWQSAPFGRLVALPKDGKPAASARCVRRGFPDKNLQARLPQSRFGPFPGWPMRAETDRGMKAFIGSNLPQSDLTGPVQP
jgi:hypothetical protein